jgi:Tol biopolymer transport system component
VTLPEARPSWPLWTPDGTHIAFIERRPGATVLRVIGPDGTSSDEPSALPGVPACWTADGSGLLYVSTTTPSLDIRLLERDGARWRDRPVVATSATEANPHLSPDGRWLSYTSDQSGRAEVYVRRFPDSGRVTLVSTEGGAAARWAPSGRELFYIRGKGIDLVAHSVSADGRISPVGRVLYHPENLHLIGTTPVAGFDIAADGRFLWRQSIESTLPPPPSELHIIENWFAELKAKAGTE